MEVRDRQKLAKLLILQGISGRELSRIAGWAPSYGGMILRGERTFVSSEAADRIALHLDVPQESLFVSKLSTNTGQNDQPVEAAAS